MSVGVLEVGIRSVAGGGVRVVEMPGRQGDGGQRGSRGQRIELGRKERREARVSRE